MVAARGGAGGAGGAGLSSEEDSAGSWQASRQLSAANDVRTATTSVNVNVNVNVNRQVAIGTLATMHRRFGLPALALGQGRPIGEFRASANKSLDALRQNVQAAVTKDIDRVIKKYLETFFVPAVNNIRSNLGDESVSEEQLRAVCRAMLDGARALYAAPPRASPSELSDSESSNGADSRFGRPVSSPSYGKRKESDTDSDVGVAVRRKRRVETNSNFARKWDPARLTQDTLFIMGSIANKVLGLGQSRGRLYSKHAGLLRYPADSADKEWIANQNLKTSSGGKTYIMVLEDIEELIVSEDYRHSSALRLSELSCFRAPPFMLRKIQAYLSSKSDASEDYASSTPTPTPPPIESIPSVSSQSLLKEENTSDHNIYDVPSTSRTKNEDTFKKNGDSDSRCSQYCKDARCAQIQGVDGGFTSIVSTGISENNYWNDPSRDIKVELNPAAELMDADIEFLSGDFCSYADSEADVKKSFDKITEGSGNDIFLPDNTNLLEAKIEPCNSDSDLETAKHSTEGDMSKSFSLNDLQDFVTTSNSSMMSPQSVTSYPPTLNASSFQQALPSFSQITAPLQAHVITTPTTQASVQVTCVAWQPTFGQGITRTVSSISSTRSANSVVTSVPTIVSIANRTTGNIIAGASGFINISPKSFSSGNILHNALVSRNMVNRGLSANLPRTLNSVTTASIHRPPSLVLPGVATFTRAPVVTLPKMDDDMSITTTKAMIDNTCNSSAMLKQVLTLGSAGVNKTFLSPQSSQKAKPSLSASHATLSALLSGIDPSHSDKKGGVSFKGDKSV